MRAFELRVYRLRTKEALDFYVEQIYPRHLSSFPLFGIEAHGFWIAREDVEPRLFVLASYAAGEEPGEVARRYMQSTEFAEDIRNFDVSDIVGVESTILIPSTSSPLKRLEEKAERTHWGTALYMMMLPCFFFEGRNLNPHRGVVYGGIHDGSPKCRRNYRRRIDGWK